MSYPKRRSERRSRKNGRPSRLGGADFALPMSYALAVSNCSPSADPHDPGMLDVVGSDTATPQLISNLARGAL